ncbi:MAG: hypothetical protein VW258_12300 [Thalassolituus sp.]
MTLYKSITVCLAVVSLLIPSLYTNAETEAKLNGNLNSKNQTLTYRGDAFSLESGKLLYTEHHQLFMADGKPVRRITEYQDAELETFAVKENRYSDNPATPDFHLNDTRSGYTESVSKNGENWQVSYSEQNAGGNSQGDKGQLKQPDYTAVIDAGFDEFVRASWDKLLKDKTVKFSFAVPSRLEWIDFRLIPLEITDQVVRVEMRLKSRLLSWLLAPVELTYERSTQRLLTYRGLTNIRDRKGQGTEAEIRYTYPDKDSN